MQLHFGEQDSEPLQLVGLLRKLMPHGPLQVSTVTWPAHNSFAGGDAFASVAGEVAVGVDGERSDFAAAVDAAAAVGVVFQVVAP